MTALRTPSFVTQQYSLLGREKGVYRMTFVAQGTLAWIVYQRPIPDRTAR